MRINPTAARKFGHAGVSARDHIQFARERNEQLAAVLRQLKTGEAAQTLAFALAPAPFLRGELLLGALEQSLRRKDFAHLSIGDGEFVKPKDRIARAAAQEHYRFAIRRDFWRNRLT